MTDAPDPGTARLRSALIRFAEALVLTLAIALVITRFVALDATSHSASDTLRPWLLQAGLVAAVAALVLRALERRSGAGSRRG